MRRASFIVLVFVTLVARGQHHELIPVAEVNLSSFAIDLMIVPDVNAKRAHDELEEHLTILEKRERNFESKLDFARFVFVKTQSRFLRDYIKYTDFSQMFEKGEFNCLTGTALFAHIYTRLGFQVELFETRLHSFLQIHHEGTAALIESTDQRSGFILGKEAAELKCQIYIQNEDSVNTKSLAISLAKYPRIKKIDFRQLAGLQYFNLGVVAVNEGRYSDALCQLEIAARFYPESERIIDLKALTRELILGDNPSKNVSQISQSQTSNHQ